MDDIHLRRMVFEYCPVAGDNLRLRPIKGKDDIGRFEKKYGYPTDIDAVWLDREKYVESKI